MITDDIKIDITAGHGGRGAVEFQKAKNALGPISSPRCLIDYASH